MGVTIINEITDRESFVGPDTTEAGLKTIAADLGIDVSCS